jgi:hypothetical protein
LRWSWPWGPSKDENCIRKSWKDWNIGGMLAFPATSCHILLGKKLISRQALHFWPWLNFWKVRWLKDCFGSDSLAPKPSLKLLDRSSKFSWYSWNENTISFLLWEVRK